jgi:hypothetical protein
MRDQTISRRVYYVALFDDHDDAELAARDLRERGFKDEHIGYAWRDDAGKTQEHGSKVGKMTSAVAGGIAGALVGLGVPENEAKYYDEEFRNGRTLLTVKADERYADGRDIARQRRGYDYETREEPALEQESEVRR